MLRTRVIPVLLLKNQGLVKPVRFKNPTYVGDPINTVRIFNEKEVDELIFLDITATLDGKEPNFSAVSDIASECFMPFGYGGGITNLEQIEKILQQGAEKVILNSIVHRSPQLVKEAVKRFGSQSIVVSIDAKKRWLGRGYDLYSHSGTKKEKIGLKEFVKQVEDLGAGEIVITSIDRDGTFAGYDVDLIQIVSQTTRVPVVACGGARSVEDFSSAVEEGGCSAVAAGSMFIFHGKHRAVLVTYPSQDELSKNLD